LGVNPTMTLLHDGRVLIAGGQADVYKSTLLATAQLFDPFTETFTPTGSMAVPRWRHSMTTLPDGRVLVAGGEGTADVAQPSGDPIPPVHLAEAEIYDPQTGRFTPAGAMSQVRGETMAVPLPDGSVVVLPQWGASSAYRSDAVGLPPTYDPTGQVPVEIYDPTSGTFASGGTTPGIATTATLLGSGRILLTGNVLTSNGIAPPATPLAMWAVIYDPLSGRTETTASPPAAFSTPVALSHGQQVLFVGGRSPTLDGGNVDAVPWVEIFQ